MLSIIMGVEEDMNVRSKIWGAGFAALVLVLAAVPAGAAQNGLITLASNHSAADTLQRLESEVTSRGFAVFGKLDHAAAAAEAELEMPFSTVLVFGNPKLGTPGFLEQPTLAIDLPIKALVWEDADGAVSVSYNSAAYLFDTIYARHGASFPPPAPGNVEGALAAIVGAAVE